MLFRKIARMVPFIVLLGFLLSLLASTGLLGAHRALGRIAGRLGAVNRIAGTSQTTLTRSAPGPTMPQRAIASPANLKGFTQALKPEKQHLAPSRGAPFAETAYLKNLYVYGSPTNPLVKLVNDPKIGLFYKQNTQFRPTQNKSNPAYSLTSKVLGHLISLIEHEMLKNINERQELLNVWKKEHTALTGDKLSNTKIELFLQLVYEAATHDKTQTINILLGFLYHKAHDKKDLVEYTDALHTKTPVLAAELPAHFVDDHFDTATLKQPLRTSDKNQITKMLTTQFDTTVAQLITCKKMASIYPPHVIQESYGYKGQQSRPNCVETAFNGMYNILLYNADNNSFDVTLLPQSIQLNDQFKQFYTTICTPTTINHPTTGQAFMDMVSDIPGIKYKSNKNYELEAASCEHNFLQLTNRFFGLTAQNYDELGKQLSTEKRTITFVIKKIDKTGTTITMTIATQQSDYNKATLVFCPGNGFLTTTKGKSEHILNNNDIETLWHHAVDGEQSEQASACTLLPLITNQMRGLANDRVNNERTLTNRTYPLNFDDPNTLCDIICFEIDTYATSPTPSLYNEILTHLTHLEKFNNTIFARNVSETIIAKKLHTKELDAYLIKHNNPDNILWALSYDNPHAFKLFVDAGLGLDKALFKICESQTINLEKLTMLLNAGANPNATKIYYNHYNRYDTVLHLMLLELSYSEHLESAVKLLISAGADINARNKNGKTPLHCAKGDRTKVEMLLRLKADPNIVDKENGTVLHYAVTEYTTLVPLLIEAGANVNIQNKYKNTPLHHTHSVTLTKKLLQAGANPNAVDNRGNTFLHSFLAHATNTLDTFQESLAYALKAGFNIQSKNKYNETLLHYAKEPSLIKMLIAAGADINAQDHKGNTLLHRSLGSFPWLDETTATLVATGADVNIQNNDGETVLHLAYKYGAYKLASLLINAGADTSIRDKEGKTPYDYIKDARSFYYEKGSVFIKHTVPTTIAKITGFFKTMWAKITG